MALTGPHERDREAVDGRVTDRGLDALAQNVRRARLARGLSLRALAERSGTSKALLSQIERMEANPTIAVVGRLAGALDQSVADLVRDAMYEPTVVRASPSAAVDPSTVEVRTLFASLDRCRFEIAEGIIPAGVSTTKSSHGAASVEYAVVLDGDVCVRSNGWEVELSTGDAIRFSAEFEHVYAAGDRPARMLTIVGFHDD